MPMTERIMQSNHNRHFGNEDRLSGLHFAWWVGFLILCIALWEFDKAVVAIILVSVFLLPPLLFVWLVGGIRSLACRQWRCAASALLGPPLAGALIFALSSVGFDPDRIHFLLVKYPHEIEIHSSISGKNAVHSWSWGIDAAPLSSGIAYTLKYDPTDREFFAAKVPAKTVRPMGDHFYIVKESEDGSPL